MYAGCETRTVGSSWILLFETVSCRSASWLRFFGKLCHVGTRVFPIRHSLSMKKKKKKEIALKSQLKPGYVLATLLSRDEDAQTSLFFSFFDAPQLSSALIAMPDLTAATSHQTLGESRPDVGCIQSFYDMSADYQGKESTQTEGNVKVKRL